MKVLIIVLLFSSFATFAFATERVYSFKTPHQREQFYNLIKNLRCLVCQNQSLLNSEAPLALDLKNIVYKKVIAGKTNKEIITYLTRLYGDFILYNPPIVKRTYILWFLPVGLLLLLLVVFGVFFVRRRYA